MNMLLDTHALLWLFNGDDALGRDAREALADERNSVFVSAVSLYEIAVKIRIGKLTIDLDELVSRIDESDFDRLYVEDRHCAIMAGLPVIPKHRDPFDIMLVAQAIAENLAIVTSDAKLRQYPVTLIPCAGGFASAP